MSEAKKCKAGLPERFLECAKQRMTQYKILSLGEYLENLLHEERLSRDTYVEYRRSNDPTFEYPEKGLEWEDYCIIGIDEWIDSTNLSKKKDVDFYLSEETHRYLSEKAKHHKIGMSKYLAILICKDVVHEHGYMNYRSIHDKVWFHQHWLEEYGAPHPDAEETAMEEA